MGIPSAVFKSKYTWSLSRLRRILQPLIRHHVWIITNRRLRILTQYLCLLAILFLSQQIQVQSFLNPIGSSNRNEFFLIANRQNTSYYDRLMWVIPRGDPYRVLTSAAQDYDKGIYIYHAYPGQYNNSSGYPWGINIDIECADGL